jgi:hypothetical protein
MEQRAKDAGSVSQDPSDGPGIPPDDAHVATIAREFVAVFGERGVTLARVQADLADSPEMRAVWNAVTAWLEHRHG